MKVSVLLIYTVGVKVHDGLFNKLIHLVSLNTLEMKMAGAGEHVCPHVKPGYISTGLSSC